MKEEEVEEEEDRVKIAKEEDIQVTFTIIPAFYNR